MTVDLSNLSKISNSAYYPLFHDFTRTLVLYGGAGSGKSVFAADKIIENSLVFNGRNTAVVRKVGKTNRTSTFPMIKQRLRVFGIYNYCKINESEMKITLPNHSEIIFLGMDDPEKIKSITFANGILTNVWMEEATDFDPEDFKQINLRLRGLSEKPFQIVLTFNPISELSWAKEYFFDNPKDNCKIIKTTYKDNAFLDSGYRSELEALKDIDETYYNIYCLGDWGVIGNLIFSNYVIEEFELPHERYTAISYGTDFGFNDPSVILKVGMYDNEIYVFDELYQTKLTNTDLISIAKEFIPPSERHFDTPQDCAEPDRIEEFKQAGFRAFPVKKGAGSIKAGIDFLKRYKIHIHRTKCPNTAREITSYKYKDVRIRTDKGYVTAKSDEPVPFNDHCMDALRYATESWRDLTPKLAYAFL